nr:immunoglobulin light chain junction region [Macaca mulatta]
CLQDIQLLLTF